jgi:hypothetical protein
MRKPFIKELQDGRRPFRLWALPSPGWCSPAGMIKRCCNPFPKLPAGASKNGVFRGKFPDQKITCWILLNVEGLVRAVRPGSVHIYICCWFNDVFFFIDTDLVSELGFPSEWANLCEQCFWVTDSDWLVLLWIVEALKLLGHVSYNYIIQIANFKKSTTHIFWCRVWRKDIANKSMVLVDRVCLKMGFPKIAWWSLSPCTAHEFGLNHRFCH